MQINSSFKKYITQEIINKENIQETSPFILNRKYPFYN